MAEPKMLEIQSPNQCIILIHGVLGAKSGTGNTVVTVPCATPLHIPQLSCSGTQEINTSLCSYTVWPRWYIANVLANGGVQLAAVFNNNTCIVVISTFNITPLTRLGLSFPHPQEGHHPPTPCRIKAQMQPQKVMK